MSWRRFVDWMETSPTTMPYMLLLVVLVGPALLVAAIVPACSSAEDRPPRVEPARFADVDTCAELAEHVDDLERESDVIAWADRAQALEC